MRHMTRGSVKMAVVVVVAMLIAGGAGVLVTKHGLLKAGAQASDGSSQAAKAQDAKSNGAANEHVTGQKSGENASSASHGAAEGTVVDLGEFLLNVDSLDQLRYVKCQIALQVVVKDKKRRGHGKGQGSVLTPDEEAWAKDTVIRVFTDTPFEQLRTQKGREKLRARLLQALQKVLSDVAINEVLFTSFVMQ
jgi:flagellar basal body-associated protein FliL